MSKEVQKHILEFFKIQEFLGSGAYGHVWKVTQISTSKIYALKKVFDAFQNSVDAQRTYRQITILHQIENQNIIKLKAVIKAKNNQDLYLVFEHMFTDLHTIVEQNILQTSHLLFIIYQIFKALKYIHSAQLVHRDLKPSNILINTDCRIKLCDFGLVRSLTHEENSVLILSEDVATRWYRSPQMLLGSSKYGSATDVWSVGCIIAELIIGEPLMMGGSNTEQLQKILQLTGPPKVDDIESLKSQVGRTLIQKFTISKKPFHHYFKASKFQSNQKLINLIKRMLEFNPQKRISVEQVLNHSLLEQFRNFQGQTICSKFIVPALDDNVRLDICQYRNCIYKDIERRYPQYNLEKIEEKPASIFRLRKGHNSLFNKIIQIDNLTRANTNISLTRTKLKKEKKDISNSDEPELFMTVNSNHNSLHVNTVQSSNFYKTVESNLYQKSQSSNSLYFRKRPFISSMEKNSKHLKNRSEKSMLDGEKKINRKYKKSRQKQNVVNSRSKVVGFEKQERQQSSEKQNTLVKTGSEPGFSQEKSKQQKLNPNQTVLRFFNSQKFFSAINFGNCYFKQGKKSYKNLYKLSQASNQNKMAKKSFNRVKKQELCNLTGLNKYSSKNNKSMALEEN